MKKLITAILLVFVVVSIVAIINKENQTEQTIDQPVLNDKTVVYYFHGTKRCKTCNKIESLTREAVNQNFAEDLTSGALKMKSVNVEHAENEHFVKDFQLSTKTVVVAKYNNNEIADWKKCDEVWQLVGEPVKFREYIITETKPLLEG